MYHVLGARVNHMYHAVGAKVNHMYHAVDSRVSQNKEKIIYYCHIKTILHRTKDTNSLYNLKILLTH